MLKIVIPGAEYFNDKTQEFTYSKDHTLQLEHSLVSLSKWESKWRKPFLSPKPKTLEEQIDYVRCMTLTQNVPPDVYGGLTTALLTEINAYIEDSMTATTFSKDRKTPPSRDRKSVV